ncbi:hypothetical protein TYRP_019495 [Tyrophagus putrescentiae]|nr:hypothetical protein TYRP_019495 [Tyrophagus putrescentiae]
MAQQQEDQIEVVGKVGEDVFRPLGARVQLVGVMARQAAERLGEALLELALVQVLVHTLKGPSTGDHREAEEDDGQPDQAGEVGAEEAHQRIEGAEELLLLLLRSGRWKRVPGEGAQVGVLDEEVAAAKTAAVFPRNRN